MTMAFRPEELAGRSKVQQLYDACNAVFCRRQGCFPTLREIRWLQGLLDTVEAVDVGVDGSESSDDDDVDERGAGGMGDDVDVDVEGSDQKGRRRRRRRNGRLISGSTGIKEITYVHIHECNEFSMGVFCFPAGAMLPLHDHPHMVVLSKVLYGSVSARSYDWVSTPVSDGHRKYGLARMVMHNQVLEAPCRASVLFPRSGGNMHSFTAVTPCAILDVLAPPYAEELGRPSTYYSEIRIPSQLPGFAILEETEVPDDLVVNGAPYLGPQIAVDADLC